MAKNIFEDSWFSCSKNRICVGSWLFFNILISLTCSCNCYWAIAKTRKVTWQCIFTPDNVKGAEIDFSFVSNRGDQYLSEAFGPLKNIVPSQSYNQLEVSTAVKLYFARNFQSAARKIDLKLTSNSFWSIILKLSGYFLGTNSKSWTRQNFDLSL